MEEDKEVIIKAKPTTKERQIQRLVEEKERTKRRYELLHLSLRGYTNQQLADNLNISLELIKKELKIAKNEAGKELNTLTAKEVLGWLNAHQRNRIKELWRIYDDSNTKKSEKIKIVSELREEEKLMIQKYQILGVLPKESTITMIEAEKAEINQTINTNADNRVVFNIVWDGEKSTEKERILPEEEKKLQINKL